MLCDVVRRRRRTCLWSVPLDILTIRKELHCVPIFMHTCGFFFYNYGAPLGGALGHRSSAIINLTNLVFSALFDLWPCASHLCHKSMRKNSVRYLLYGPRTRLARGMPFAPPLKKQIAARDYLKKLRKHLSTNGKFHFERYPNVIFFP